MIYSVPLSTLEAHILRTQNKVVDLDADIFVLNIELRSITPNTRFVEAKAWAFNDGNDIIP